METKNISLIRSEMAILALNLNVMNKSIKRGFKRNYNSAERKEKINTFNITKEYINNELNEDREEFSLSLDQEQIDFIHSFLAWYIEELKIDAEIESFNCEDNEILYLLDSVMVKMENQLDPVEEKVN